MIPDWPFRARADAPSIGCRNVGAAGEVPLGTNDHFAFQGVVAPRTNAWATPDSTAANGFRADAPKAPGAKEVTPYGLFPPVPGANAFRTPLDTPRAKSPTSSLAILPPLPDCFYAASPRSAR